MAAATALAAGSLIVAAGTSAVSFSQAAKQRKKMEEANKKAEEMMLEARKKLEVNVFEDLDVNKELYTQEQDRINESAQLALQAGQEGDQRGAAATAGRIQLAAQDAQAKTRISQEARVNEIEGMVAKEEGRLRDLGVQLDLAEVEGAQQAAADAEAMRAASIQQGIQSAGSALQQGLGMVPLMQSGSAATQRGVVGGLDLSTTAGNDAFKGYSLGGKTLDQIDFANMSNKEFRQFKGGLDATQSGLIFGSEAYKTGLDSKLQSNFGNMWGGNFAAGGAGANNEEFQKYLMMKQMGLLGDS
tara:strand:+ start:1347 stop:2249 length:903 start_codon:yes stop_codon:yes gene_type:complete